MSGWAKGFREAKERQCQIDEAVLIGANPMVSLDHFIQLKTHKAHYSCCSCGDGRGDLPCNQLALEETK